MQAKNEFSNVDPGSVADKRRFVLLCHRHHCVRKVVGAFGLISKLSLDASLCMTRICRYVAIVMLSPNSLQR